MSKKQSFAAEILATEKFKNAAYINIPFDVEQVYGKKRVKIIATFDGVKYQGSLVRMGGPNHILIVRKDIRAQINKTFGDIVDVTIEEDTVPRIVEVPKDLENKLKKDPIVLALFEKLSYSKKKELVQWINDAKKEQTRINRINKAIELIQNKK